jgi:hypothetical protein
MTLHRMGGPALPAALAALLSGCVSQPPPPAYTYSVTPYRNPAPPVDVGARVATAPPIWSDISPAPDRRTPQRPARQDRAPKESSESTANATTLLDWARVISGRDREQATTSYGSSSPSTEPPQEPVRRPRASDDERRVAAAPSKIIPKSAAPEGTPPCRWWSFGGILWECAR